VKIVLIGEKGSGKTTLWSAFTGERAGYKVECREGTVILQDARLTEIAKFFNTNKLTFPHLALIDIPGFDPKALNLALVGDAVIFVIPFFGEFKNPIELAKKLDDELFLHDISSCETRIKNLKKSGDEFELHTVEKCLRHLNKKTPLRKIGFTKEERKLLHGFGFLTYKPAIAVLNYDEKKDYKKVLLDLRKFYNPHAIEVYPFPAKLFSELNELPENEREEYLRAYEIEPFIKDKVLRAIISASGFLLFYTVVRGEARSWLLRAGSHVIDAAGTIHTDMARGFIRAEIINYKDLKDAKDLQELHKKGAVKTVGKDYPVNDGDIIEVKFH